MDTSKAKLARRALFYTAGMFVMATGITLTIYAAIGISPISSLNRTMTVVQPMLTQGTYAFLLNCLMFLLEYLVLPKDFKASNFLQLIPAFVSSAFLDLNLWLLAGMRPELYSFRLIQFVLGCLVAAFGLFTMIRTEIILMPLDAFVSVVVKRFKVKWGNVKSVMDLTMVALSAAIGLVFLGRIVFIREGTVLNAILVGQFIKMYGYIANRLQKPKAADASLSPASEIA